MIGKILCFIGIHKYGPTIKRTVEWIKGSNPDDFLRLANDGYIHHVRTCARCLHDDEWISIPKADQDKWG